MRTALLLVSIAIACCTGCEKRIHEARVEGVQRSPLAIADVSAARPRG